MGSFASGVFSAMLSWIRSAVAYLWGMSSTPEGGGLIRWLGDNWLTVAVILCAAGVAVDYVVHILRWQPYKVWLSFFRRIARRGEKAEDKPARRTVRRQVIYADGTARTETVEHEEPLEPEPVWPETPSVLQESSFDQEAYRRQFARPGSQPPPVEGLEDYPQPVKTVQAEPEPEPAPEPAQPVRRGRRITRESARSAFAELFASHDEDELDLRYKPAQPAISKEEAYNKPYIPPQWKPPAEARGAREEQ